MLLIASCMVLAALIWTMDRASLQVALSTYAGSYGFFVNAIPFVVFFLLFLVSINRLTVAMSVTLVLALALYVANFLKLKFLSVPVAFSDLYLLRDIHLSTIHLLSNYAKVWYLLLAALLLIAWAIASWRFEWAFFRKGSWVRLLLGVAAFYLAVTFVTAAGWTSRVYDPIAIRLVPWSPVLTILHGGLASSIEYSNLDYAKALNVPVDNNAVKAFVDMPSVASSAGATASSDAIADNVRPDIVIIQSESFFDPSILKDIADTKTSLPNLHRAMDQGTGGTMKAPTFGGGTLRTEFEVLTGIPMEAYPEIDFPYLQINKDHIPSLVGVLHDAGYAAYAVHGNDGNFWNRAKAFHAMGFDRFLTAADFPANAIHEGWFLSDSAMTDQIIGLLDKAKSPMVVFAVSIEGHGPYGIVPVGDKARRDSIQAPEKWPAGAVNDYKNYMYHIENADQQLGRLWAYLQTRRRPYVLAFYGDHLPGLDKVYQASGFDDKLSGPEEFVPWFILTSQGVEMPRKHIDAWMLGGEILKAAGVNKPLYYQLVSKAEGIMQNRDNASKGAAMQGVDSISRLYLTGQLDKDIEKITAAEVHP
ncbi:LTA synthase family protein [Rhodanobacter sp. L36]|uniref:LTA synthase family protein n=1 Tax=Rhodanobacter sp. L36 TaxID=1747221 RepID=UPI00131D2530|nr:LTA synthase family protein [Rhodanobacter sp. L36]